MRIDHRNRPLLAVVAAVAGLLAAPAAGRADTVSFTGIGKNGYGSFSGYLTVDPVSNSLAEITVGLSNTTSPASAGGYITGFAFNDPGTAAGGDIGGVVASPPGYSTTMPTFKAIGAPDFENSIVVNDGVDAPPYGLFDLGAAIGGDWSGGGSPTTGIGIGGSATFAFQVFGANLNNLTARSVFDTVSEPQSRGKGDFEPENFVVRFRGGSIPDGWSDKAPAVEDVPPTSAPAPAGLILAGIAAAAGLGFRRRAGN